VTIHATVNGTALPSETYTKSGEYTYSHDVPPNVISGEAVKVEFAMDRALPPTGADQRELGLVVSVVGFEPK
jgi:hypothetical protein